MKKIIHLFLFVCLISACSSRKDVVISNPSGNTFNAYFPPNQVQLDSNLFVDKTELSVIDYKEYLYWTKKVFGKNSKKYLTALPDTTVWKSDLENIDVPNSLAESYFTHPSFADYPMVGISYEQVIEYSKWRSDRVFEMYLILKEKIQDNPNQNAEMYFSIDNYFQQKYLDYIPDFDIPYPDFRLPSKSEWEQFAKGQHPENDPSLGIQFSDKNVQRFQKKGAPLFCTQVTKGAKKISDSDVPNFPTAPVRSYLPNDFEAYNWIGNVSEMTVEKGISKGGSWSHPLEKCKIENDILYEKPTTWLGFRNVSEFKFYKKQKE